MRSASPPLKVSVVSAARPGRSRFSGRLMRAALAALLASLAVASPARALEDRFASDPDLQQFVDSKPSDQDILDLERKYGHAVFQPLRTVPRWSDDAAA